MPLTRNQLRERWDTPKGRACLEDLLSKAQQDKEPPWNLLVVEGMEEVPNRKDLRFAPFAGRQLERILLNGADLSGADFTDAVLAGVGFSGTQCVEARFRNAEITGGNFEAAKLESADFTGARIWTSFNTAKAKGAIFDACTIKNTNMASFKAPGASFRGATLTDVGLQDADLCNAILCDLKGVRVRLNSTQLMGADLTHAKLSYVQLTGTQWENAKLHGIRLAVMQYGLDHQVMLDGTDRIQIPPMTRLFNWSRLLRTLGQLPLFGISWSAFVFSVALVNLIGALNKTQFVTQLEYPVPIPHRIQWIIVSSIFLVLGTTTYRIFCPQRVQEFSEAEWVEEHKQPRLLYLTEAWKKRPLQWVALILSSIGASIAAWLVVERLYLAATYIVQALGNAPI